MSGSFAGGIAISAVMAEVAAITCISSPVFLLLDGASARVQGTLSSLQLSRKDTEAVNPALARQTEVAGADRVTGMA